MQVKVISMIKTYTQLLKFQTFEDRFNYLKLSGKVGKETFGFDRVFNQIFYSSSEWKRIRDLVIIRDNGCDLGIDGHRIYNSKIIVHHMNPISLEDIEKQSEILLNPEYLITTIHSTHNAIHYSNDSYLINQLTERKINDTCPWKKI